MTNFNEAPNPEQSEEAMEPRLCKCGCGTEMPNTNKWEYLRGHKTSDNRTAPPRKPKTTSPVAEEDEVEEAPTRAVEMNDAQFNRIWEMFSLNQKAFAVVYGLTADRE